MAEEEEEIEIPMKVVKDEQTTDLVTTQVSTLKRTFQYFDTGNKGFISTLELRNILRHLGMNPTEGEIIEIMNVYDENESGKLEQSEFLQLMTQKLQLVDTEEEVRQIFAMFDKNGNGYIDANELRSMFHYVFGNDPTAISMTDLEEIMEDLDKDGDGRLNYQEFAGLIMEYV